jgi:hypothetical protein
MRSAPAKIPVSIALAPELRDTLNAFAAQRERSRSWVVGQALAEYLRGDTADTSSSKGREPETQPFDSLLSLKVWCAVVTGGSRGLGEAIVRRLAEVGASTCSPGAAGNRCSGS